MRLRTTVAQGKRPWQNGSNRSPMGRNLLFSSLAFTVIMGVAWFQKTQFTRVGYATVALIYLAERFKTYYFNANYYRQRFNVNVVANAVGALANPLVRRPARADCTRVLHCWRAPLAASVAASVCYCRVHPEQQLRFRWDPVEALRLLKVGCVLSFVRASVLGGFAWWIARRVTLFMSHSDLGYYFYAATYVLMGLNVLADFGRVLESMLWSRGGQVADTEQFRRDTVKLSLFIACVGGAAIPALQAGYETLITLLVPKFRGTVDLFNVMSLAIFSESRGHWFRIYYCAPRRSTDNIGSHGFIRQRLCSAIGSHGFIRQRLCSALPWIGSPSSSAMGS